VTGARLALALGAAVATFAVAPRVRAQIPRERPLETREVAPEPEPPEDPTRPPPASTGFQAALRTGVAIPAGRIAHGAGNGMPTVFFIQIPFLLEMGFKPLRWLFVGSYAGFALGPTGDDVGQICPDCSTSSVRIGLEALASFRPGERSNPWLGYGFGYESSGAGRSDNRVAVTYSGLELAHLIAGLDFRISRNFGMGPFVDVAIGRYVHDSVHGSAQAQHEDHIDRPAFHTWTTLGLRFVARP
jgi:hypothetical protein